MASPLLPSLRSRKGKDRVREEELFQEVELICQMQEHRALPQEDRSRCPPSKLQQKEKTRQGRKVTLNAVQGEGKAEP